MFSVCLEIYNLSALLLHVSVETRNNGVNRLHSQHILLALRFSFCAGLIPFWLFYSLCHCSLSVFYLPSIVASLVTTHFVFGCFFLLSFFFFCLVHNFFPLFLLNVYACGPIQSSVASINIIFVAFLGLLNQL